MNTYLFWTIFVLTFLVILALLITIFVLISRKNKLPEAWALIEQKTGEQIIRKANYKPKDVATIKVEKEKNDYLAPVGHNEGWYKARPLFRYKQGMAEPLTTKQQGIPDSAIIFDEIMNNKILLQITQAARMPLDLGKITPWLGGIAALFALAIVGYIIIF